MSRRWTLRSLFGLDAAPVPTWVRWLLVGPILGFFLNQALLNFRADRPVLAGLHAIGLISWFGLLLILDSHLI